MKDPRHERVYIILSCHGAQQNAAFDIIDEVSDVGQVLPDNLNSRMEKYHRTCSLAQYQYGRYDVCFRVDLCGCKSGWITSGGFGKESFLRFSKRVRG